jgi:aminomethyltransferase
MPVQYEQGVIKEHMAVRTAAGLFDVSHMGEVLLKGSDALRNLNYLLTNDFSDMASGQIRYAMMCNEAGGIIDDLIVYKMGTEEYMLVINASNRHKDIEWIKAHLFGEVTLDDISDQVALIALQGPLSEKMLCTLTDTLPEKNFTFLLKAHIQDIPCLISRSGYTGEVGFEVYLENQYAEKLFARLLDAGKDDGILPCGLGARDTLRLEASMPLYGHEMDETITPFEAGLGYAVKMDKEDFIGRTALVSKAAPERRRIGLKVVGRGIVREDYEVFSGGEQVGITTSGTHCPYLKGAYAMALVDQSCTAPGTMLEVDVRGRLIEAEVVPLPFYKNKSAAK